MGISGLAAVLQSDDGALVEPVTPEDWDTWVSAGRTRNYVEGDPLLDWLDRYGRQNGFTPDDELDAYDPRTDMRRFVLEHGIAFEDAVMALIRERCETVRVSEGPASSRDVDRALLTVEHMRAGVPVIEQAVLRNPETRTYGIADLLVRADMLERFVPGTLSDEEAHLPSPELDRSWHYRVVDVKFRSLSLLASGHASTDLTHYAVQVFLYNGALCRIQGGVPSSAYLLGRGWTQGEHRGSGCFDRMARVDRDHVARDGTALADLADEAVRWIRRLRADGAGWQVFPRPTVPELYPHARHHEDQPWHVAKEFIAGELGELTLLPGMNPPRRAAAHAKGLRTWRDPAVNAGSLEVEDRFAAQCDAVLAVNRDAPELVVVPDRIRHADPPWRTSAAIEFYVDFETVSNLADDFSALPATGGQPLIFQIGCGRIENAQWRFEQWTADRIQGPNEGAIIGQWVDHMASVLLEHGLNWGDARIVHWSAAEPTNLDSAYNAARDRHPENDWPILPWFDFLQQVIRTEPVAVRGAFGFGLKPIAKGMHAAGLIETTWGEGPTDGLGAMVGAWWCDGEAARLGCRMADIELTQEIARYNEVDCRAMSEVIAWLRANR